MPFDPNLPQENTLIDAAQMRTQLNGLHDLIVPGPAGPQGPQGIPGPQGVAGAPGVQGEQGPPFAGVIVDGVATLPPGDAATVTANLVDVNVHLSFGLPSGADGSDGAPGLPFAAVDVVGVTTLPAGSDATVTAVLSGDVVHLSFGLPKGADGADGTNGTNGSDGSNGSDGAPGEVTNAQLDAAIAGTSANSNAVATLDTPMADPDSEALRQKFNEMLLAQRR
jgi:hypothetical protein